MSYFVHPQGLCETTSVGQGTRIWAFAHVLPGAIIGRDCNICDHVFIENKVVLGDRVTVKCGVQLWDGLQIEHDVFIGPNATFSNDPFPRSKQHQATIPSTIIRRNASIGAGAVILPDLTIGQNSMIGAGAVVTTSVPPNAIVMGNPGRIVGYVDTVKSSSRRYAFTDMTAADDEPSLMDTIVRGVVIHKLKLVEDIRGNLAVGEFTRSVPFVPQRYYTIFDVPGSRVRGQHALRSCHQFLICVRGSCVVVTDDAKNRQEVILDQPNMGLHVPPMIWSTLYKFTADAVLMVFASTFYDPSDYVRDYEDYLILKSASAPAQ